MLWYLKYITYFDTITNRDGNTPTFEIVTLACEST